MGRARYVPAGDGFTTTVSGVAGATLKRSLTGWGVNHSAGENGIRSMCHPSAW